MGAIVTRAEELRAFNLAQLPPRRLCAEAGCGKPHYARDFCKAHYNIKRNRGQVLERRARQLSDAALLLEMGGGSNARPYPHRSLPPGPAPASGVWAQTACEGVRAHRYRIETPNGPTVAATCVQCGQTREYKTVIESVGINPWHAERGRESLRLATWRGE